MNPFVYWCGLGLAALATLPGLAAAAEALPAADWVVEAPAGGEAKISENDGVLQVDYRLPISEPFQSGHIAYRQGLLRLLRKEPLKLGRDIRRIAFEACGLESRRRGAEKTLLLPLIRDEQGEILAYSAHPQALLKSGAGKWSSWKTSDFYGLEAGGASSDVCAPLTPGGNAWPDGELTFLGFALTERADKSGERAGQVQLGAWAAQELAAPAEEPYVYADAFFEKAGTYRLGIQIFRQFQGPPYREIARTVTFDPTRPASARQKLSFPLGPDDNYWIRYAVATADGSLVNADTFRAWVEGAAPAAEPTPVDLHQTPPVGCLRLNPDAVEAGVYAAGEPLVMKIRAFPADRPYALRWQLQEYAYAQTLQNGEETVAPGNEPRELALELKLPTDAGRFVAEAVRDGQVLDRQEYVLGRRTDFAQPYVGRTGARIPREVIKQSAYFRISYLPYQGGQQTKFASNAEALARFKAALGPISQLTPNVTYMVDLANFEVLPGVFDFALLDQAMDAATDANCRLTIRLSHADQGAKYNWQRSWPQRNYDQSDELGHGYYGNFSPSFRPYVDDFLRGFKALHDRYYQHPAFQGYQIFEIAGEWAVLDQPWAGKIAGYERCAREQFRDWVRERIDADLAAVNRRWGTTFAGWDEVQPPLPRLADGPTPDLRLWWVDFCRFKLFLDNDYWFRTLARSIREYDRESVIIAYSLDPDGFDIPDGVAGIDYLHNGGNHELRGEGSLIDAWKHGTGWITEPHMPHRWAAYGDRGDRGWLLDCTTYVMLAQAGGGGANLHIYYYPLAGKEDLSLPAHYGREYAFDRFEKFMPILRELHGLKLQEPQRLVAVLQDEYTLFCKHRTIFQQRLNDLKRWFELLKRDAIDYEAYRADHAGQYALLLPNLLDEVMSGENIRLIGEAVRKGGRAVIAATTGRYSPERPGVDFALLRELGLPPPAKPYDTLATGVSANVTEASPFFTSGTKVGFFSLGDLQVNLRSPEIGKTFWQWPYRWIPQTNYFGHFSGVEPGGKVLARFADGGAAVSLHACGQGEVLVFWGTPDYAGDNLKGFMARACAWAGVETPRAGNPVPLTLEGDHADLNRHYAIMYQDVPGTYAQKFPGVPAGEFFIDELVGDRRLGVYTADELHAGVPLQWEAGQSPLKILRFIPRGEMGSRWANGYRLPPTAPSPKP